jgi:RNase P protein component
LSKTFAQAPKPRALSPDVIAAFERSGAGQDTQTHISAKVEKREAANAVKREQTRRLSIDLPESLHRRFKTACSRTDRKMLAEVAEFIAQRTVELEGE